MQPLQQPRDAIARFIQMFDRSLLDLLANVVGQPRQFFSFLVSHGGNGGGCQIHPEHLR